MARQVGEIRITGTIGDLCFYQMEGDFFVRRKSSLTPRRFRRDPAFEGSRRSAGLLGQASPLASRLYHRLPKERKDRNVFRALTGKVKLMLKDGRTEEEIERWFIQTYLPEPVVAEHGGTVTKRIERCRFAQAQRHRNPALYLLPPVVYNRQRNTLKPECRLHRRVKDRGSPRPEVRNTRAESSCQNRFTSVQAPVGEIHP